MGEWLYNSAARRFHTKKLCSRLYSIKIEFYSNKNEKSFLSHPLRDLGVTYALHLQLVGKPVMHFAFVIIELFFAISYDWDVISGNLSKSAFFEGVGEFERKIQTEGGVIHQSLLVSEN